MPAPAPTAHPFGRWLRDHREALGYSQTHLADLAGTTQATISRWEKGEDPPTGMRARRLARALAVSRGELDDRIAESFYGESEDDTLRYLQTLSGQDARACLRRLGMLDPPSPIRAARRTPSRAD